MTLMRTKLLFTVVLVLAIFLISTGASEAADLYTAPIFSSTNPDEVFCNLANIGAATQTYRIRIVQDDGTTVSDTGSHSLPAGAITSIGVFGNGQYHYCRFTVST